MVFHGVARGGTAGGDPDLAIHRGQVRVDGAGTDDQALGHLLIGQALGHQSQHLDLPSRQSVGRGGGFASLWNRGWSCWSRRGHRHGSLCGQHLLQRHGSPLGPCGGKELLPHVGAGGSNCLLILRAEDRGQRCMEVFA